MPYTMEDFRRDFTRDHLDLLTPEERLHGLSPEEIEDYLKKFRAAPGSRSAARKRQATGSFQKKRQRRSRE